MYRFIFGFVCLLGVLGAVVLMLPVPSSPRKELISSEEASEASLASQSDIATPSIEDPLSVNQSQPQVSRYFNQWAPSVGESRNEASTIEQMGVAQDYSGAGFYDYESVPVMPSSSYQSEELFLRLYASQTIGSGIGYHSGYTTVGAFGQMRAGSHVFFDVREHYFRSNRWASNVGIAVRYPDPSAALVYGFNLYYDWRQQRKAFHQIGVGAEVLGNRADFRCNIYVPIGNREQHLSSGDFFYPGGFFAHCREVEKAFAGADIEVGAWLRRGFHFFDFYAAPGIYYYSNDLGCKRRSQFGGKIRLKAYLSELVSVEAKASYDRVNGRALQGCITFSIPFGVTGAVLRGERSLFDRLISQPVERQEIIVTERGCKWDTNF